MILLMHMKQRTFDEEMKEMFGGKVYRLSLSSGCSCPNRDGRIGMGGCIFCSAGGSGEFASTIRNSSSSNKNIQQSAHKAKDHPYKEGSAFKAGSACFISETIDAALLSLDTQIEEARQKVAAKLSKNFAGYMAYFQSFTNTYGPVEKLEKLFSAALDRDEILALSVATRPDCLPQETVDMLARLNQRKPVWVELGLQTVHEDTAMLINRGYSLPVFEDALRRLKEAGLRVVVHVIIGLPGEDAERTKETVQYLAKLQISRRSDGLQIVEAENCLHTIEVCNGLHNIKTKQDGSVGSAQSYADCLIDGIKLQIMQVLKGTKLAQMKEQGLLTLPEYTLDEYAALLKELLDILPPEVTVHRLTGDPPKSLLISPLWTADKKRVLNTIRRTLSDGWDVPS